MIAEVSMPVAGLGPVSEARPPAGADFSELRRIWQIDATTLGHLRRIRLIIEATLTGLDESFYEPLFTEEPIRLLMRDTAVRQRAIAAMAQHWRELLSGELKNATLLRAVQVGRRHQALGVGEQHLVVASQHLLARLIRALLDAKIPEPAEAIEAVVRVVRLGVSVSLQSQAEAASRGREARKTGVEPESWMPM
jgi:hypothetical protein